MFKLIVNSGTCTYLYQQQSPVAQYRSSWDEAKAPGATGLEQIYDYTDMLGFCGWLHVLVRGHKDVGLACLAQTVNVVCYNN